MKTFPILMDGAMLFGFVKGITQLECCQQGRRALWARIFSSTTPLVVGHICMAKRVHRRNYLHQLDKL